MNEKLNILKKNLFYISSKNLFNKLDSSLIDNVNNHIEDLISSDKYSYLYKEYLVKDKCEQTDDDKILSYLNSDKDSTVKDKELTEEDIELYKIFISFMCFYTLYKNTTSST
jgi:hypothetical protein